ncbi:hypothetical protein PG997_015132 [Apiospora hydei]|uniref:C2H2-type domain-containing protein n=1 Tax=Apiospora hydei TaxID=1337664 RepID=A0ABR1UY94_9PEZI
MQNEDTLTVCWLDHCWRRGNGFKFEHELTEHLQQQHQGATLEENNVAEPRRRRQGHQESAGGEGGINYQETVGKDVNMKLIRDLELRLASLELERQHLRHQIMEERDGHQIEIEDPRKCNKSEASSDIEHVGRFTAMAQPNPPGHASSSNAGSGNQYVCQTCNKVMSSETNLWRHNKTHDKTEVCDICGKAFAKPGQLGAHQFRVHKINKSDFGRLAIHLDKVHQGATTVDNDQAAADSAIKLTGESWSEDESDEEKEEESEADEDGLPTADKGDHSAKEQSDEDTAANGEQQRLSPRNYERQYRVIKRTMAKERLRHRKEFIAIYNSHGEAIQDLEYRVAQLEQLLSSRSPE